MADKNNPRFVKITLWISLDTDGVDDCSALDVVVPAVRGLKDDLTLLDYHSKIYEFASAPSRVIARHVNRIRKLVHRRLKVEEAKDEAKIASAPELLEALETIEKTFAGCVPGDDCHCYEYIQQIAEQAIAKAKGGGDE
tara:strand:- start:550 stop:966 length:417 start_codon:yes stop_codon:yes gene_type:complete